MTPEPSGTVDGGSVRRRAILRSAGVVAGAGFVGTAAGSPGGCPNVATAGSPPPGPPVLYEKPASAPQFENGPGWNVDPLLVSGAEAHVDGEFLYQDWVYDDYGANTTHTIAPPDPEPSNHEYGGMTGDLVYPTDVERYRHNAADLLEFRARPAGDGTAYRVTFNTMVEPSLVAVALAITIDPDASARDTDLGYGLGTLGIDPDHLLITWGTGAELDGDRLPDGAVTVDDRRNQIEVEVPLNPGNTTWRHHLIVGLWDVEAGAFKQIQDQPTSDRPGGAHGQDPPPVFNVGFRSPDQEPMGSENLNDDTPRREVEEGSEFGSRGVGFGHWRDHAQAKARRECARTASSSGTSVRTSSSGGTFGSGTFSARSSSTASIVSQNLRNRCNTASVPLRLTVLISVLAFRQANLVGRVVVTDR